MTPPVGSGPAVAYALLQPGAALVGSGWGSSGSAAFDFRADGSELPMYALFVASLAVGAWGLARQLRRLGPRTARGRSPGAGGAAARALRLVRFGVFQRRIARGGDAGWTHLPISWGVAVLALGSLTIMVDGYVLRPLGLGPARGVAYRIFQAGLDAFGLALVIGLGLALQRRFRARSGPEPGDRRTTAILVALLGIAISGFVLEGLRMRLEGASEPWIVGGSAVSALVSLAPPAPGLGLAIYKGLWWGHVVAAFALVAAVPFTPLRHVITAPLNILLSPERPSGALTTPFDLRELVRSGCFDVKVGAASMDDFSWHERLAFAGCADAGRCQDVCPAHAAGTPLSPLRLLRALRAASDAFVPGGADAAELPGEAISEDAVWSCTLCGACSAACPSLVDPPGSVMALRRGLVARNRLGAERSAVLANLTRTRNPYGANPVARQDLPAALGLGLAGADRPAELVYWLGCAATFDPRVRKVAEATVRILAEAGVRCRVLGPEESCCGDPARRIGEEGLFQEIALGNIQTLERLGVTRVLTHCAHCFNTLRNEYPDLGGRFEVVHHATFIRDLIRAGSISPRGAVEVRATLHDACYAGRFNGGFEAPRSVLKAIPGTTLREMEHSGERSGCCGAGGGNYWYDVPRRERIGAPRIREARAAGAAVLVTECPYCLKMLGDACEATNAPEALRVRDIAEVVADALGAGGAS